MFFCRAKSLKISPTSRFTFPYNTLFRYFGTMTTGVIKSVGKGQVSPKWDLSIVVSFEFCAGQSVFFVLDTHGKFNS
jgi:hypothetical protein